MGWIKVFVIPSLVAGAYFLIILITTNFGELEKKSTKEVLALKQIFKYTFSALVFTVAQNTELLVYGVISVNKETIAIYDYITKFNNTLSGLSIAFWPLVGLIQLKGLKLRLNILQIPLLILSIVFTRALLDWKQCDEVPVYLIITSAMSSLLMINYMILGRADGFLSSKYFNAAVLSALILEYVFCKIWGSLFDYAAVLVALNFLKVLYVFMFHKAYTFSKQF
jgi:hypothetical protein